MNKELLLALAVAVIVFVVSQKKVYELTNRVVGDLVDELGAPTQKGVVVHALVGGVLFYVASWLVNKYA